MGRGIATFGPCDRSLELETLMAQKIQALCRMIPEGLCRIGIEGATKMNQHVNSQGFLEYMVDVLRFEVGGPRAAGATQRFISKGVTIVLDCFEDSSNI